MTIQEYLQARNEICTSAGEDCNLCPLRNPSYNTSNHCFVREYKEPEKIIADVERWLVQKYSTDCAWKGEDL